MADNTRRRNGTGDILRAPAALQDDGTFVKSEVDQLVNRAGLITEGNPLRARGSSRRVAALRDIRDLLKLSKAALVGGPRGGAGAPIFVPGGAAPPFDVTTINLTSLFRNYGGSLPWAGTASAGSSGSNSLTTGTAPSSGTALGGHVPASFASASSQSAANGALSGYLATTSGSGWALVNIPAAQTNDTTSLYNNASILVNSASSFFYLYVRGAGGASGFAGLGVFTGAASVQVETAFTFGAWQLIQWKYDNSNLMIRVGQPGVAFTSQPSAGPGAFSGNYDVGVNTPGTVFLTGSIAEIATASIVLPDSTFDNVVSGLSSYYGTSLN